MFKRFGAFINHGMHHDVFAVMLPVLAGVALVGVGWIMILGWIFSIIYGHIGGWTFAVFLAPPIVWWLNRLRFHYNNWAILHPRPPKIKEFM
jgi:hypothetical protein